MQKKPIFKNSEIVVQLPSNTIKLSSTDMETEVVGEIVFKGVEALKYEVGQKVLFDKKYAVELKYFGENMWRIPRQEFITCEINICNQ